MVLAMSKIDITAEVDTVGAEWVVLEV